jgi:hypothetical protein
MPLSTSEKALAILLGIDEALLAGRGVAARSAKAAFNATARAIVAGGRLTSRAAPPLARGALAAGSLGLRGAAALARRHPAVALGTAGLAAHELGYLDPAYEALERERQMAAESYAIAAPTIIPELERAYVAPVKRKVSKANRAVKEGMKWLKGKGKSLTGTAPGVLPGRSFVMATKAAGLANPRTKSKPGKAKTVVNKLAKTLRKWWKR